MAKKITLKQAATILGVSKGAVHAFIKDGRLTSEKRNNRIFVLDDQVQALKRKQGRWALALNAKSLTLRFVRQVRTTFKRYPKLSFLAVVLPLLALGLQYIVARPHIVTAEIRQDERNPLKAEFVIRNSGLLAAKNLDIKVVAPYLQAASGLRYMPEEGDSPTFSDQSLISGIKVAPQQQYAFSLQRWFKAYFVHIIRHGGLKTALIDVKYSYTDYLGFFDYEDTACYCLFPKDSNIVWQPVGPKAKQGFIRGFKSEKKK